MPLSNFKKDVAVVKRPGEFSFIPWVVVEYSPWRVRWNILASFETHKEAVSFAQSHAMELSKLAGVSGR